MAIHPFGKTLGERQVENVAFVHVARVDPVDVLVHWNVDPAHAERVVKLDLLKIVDYPGKRRGLVRFFNTNRFKFAFVEIDPGVVFVVAGLHATQLAVLQAVLDKVRAWCKKNVDPKAFFAGYGTERAIVEEMLQSALPDLVREAVTDDVRWLRVKCKGCGEDLDLAVPKRVVEEANRLPCLFVYLHGDHALQVYLDRNFAVRAAEVANFSW
ncbi:MAG: hypothetical protein Kow0069_05580 [Promethearchaeota archaeon]